ncbi:MAG: hypothetical protein ACM3PT_10545 [Deltaproteobacteria bacterium]
MEELSKNYMSSLQNLKEDIQSSELLEQYLETEDEETYKELVAVFEPDIDDLHNEVAAQNPLQQVAFEREILDPGFEGLFLPRILGYSVLRGELDEQYKYRFPQDHFRDIVLAIAESANYDSIQTRIGQTLQIGFALSTDIWVTDLMNKISNKNVKKFLQNQRNPKLHDQQERQVAFERYKRQFEKFNYKTTVFPADLSELKRHGNVLKDFLLYRSVAGFDNSTLIPHIDKFLNRKEFYFEPEFIRIALVLGMYYQPDEDNAKKLKEVFNILRKEKSNFGADFFAYFLQFVDDKANFIIDAVGNLSKFIDKSISDELSKFFGLMEIVYTRGYVAAETIDAVRKYYNEHEWLSNQNRCLRHSLNNRFSKFFNTLSEKDYPEFFEMFKTFAIYMEIFSNEKFNQSIKYTSMNFVNRLLKYYVDKRGRDYQDIKKFVMNSFVDLKFYKEKELSEIFKSRRKKKESK